MIKRIIRFMLALLVSPIILPSYAIAATGTAVVTYLSEPDYLMDEWAFWRDFWWNDNGYIGWLTFRGNT